MSLTHPRPLRIGTRGSQLALAQAHETRDRLMAALGIAEDAAEERFEIVVVRTTGDRITDRPLGAIGGKGLFTKEIEEALLAGRIDMAVHSMKDMPSELPEGLVLSAYAPREDPRDGFVGAVEGLAELPRGARIGTASLRRQAQALRRRPDLEPTLLRGNVPTRIAKTRAGEVDATFLAMAGLKRLGLAQEATPISTEDMLPAVAQGVIGIETRADDDPTREALALIACPRAHVELAAERAFLAALDGSCRTPLAGLARLEGGRVAFRGQILRPDGSEAHETAREGPSGDAAAMGADAGAELRARGGPYFFAEG